MSQLIVHHITFTAHKYQAMKILITVPEIIFPAKYYISRWSNYMAQQQKELYSLQLSWKSVRICFQKILPNLVTYMNNKGLSAYLHFISLRDILCLWYVCLIYTPYIHCNQDSRQKCTNGKWCPFVLIQEKAVCKTWFVIHKTITKAL